MQDLLWTTALVTHSIDHIISHCSQSKDFIYKFRYLVSPVDKFEHNSSIKVLERNEKFHLLQFSCRLPFVHGLTPRSFSVSPDQGYWMKSSRAE